MSDLDSALAQMETLTTRWEVKIRILELVTKESSDMPDPTHRFMQDVAFPYINGGTHPARESEYSREYPRRFKRLWDRLPSGGEPNSLRTLVAGQKKSPTPGRPPREP